MARGDVGRGRIRVMVNNAVAHGGFDRASRRALKDIAGSPLYCARFRRGAKSDQMDGNGVDSDDFVKHAWGGRVRCQKMSRA